MTLMTIRVTFWLYSSYKNHSSLVAMCNRLKIYEQHFKKWKDVQINQTSAGIFIIFVGLCVIDDMYLCIFPLQS
jgi:hypothetical protein